MRSYQEIKKHVLSLGFVWFEKPYSLNFIHERTSYNATNIFDCWLHVCYKDKQGQECVIHIPWTTKPGIKGSLDSPLTVEKITGTAIIQPGQYLGAWQFRDTDKEFSKHPYFRQIGKINYWRDGNKNNILDKIQAQFQKLFGTHWHIMSHLGKRGSGKVNNWSLGCMGGIAEEFDKMLPVVRRSVKMYGDKFTGTIVDSW
jgi:hypothetical protein